jgi:nitrogenase iron protein
VKQIAIYGKGGIGKSTISANLSAALALNNQKVLQIGCDPKHDSTRLLMRGEKITTVLDYLKVTSPDKWDMNDILFKGFMNISCVEAGGPEPGVGCAGRGILTTFDLLDRLGVKGLGFDMIIYDVLGDVVCGGFAVPLRHAYADTVYIVTSGEYMSIYAANNILKGVKNFDGDLKRIGGLIFNKRGVEDEEERIERFSQAVNLPVCTVIPRSDEFSRAEIKGITVIEAAEHSLMAQKFASLAAMVLDNKHLYEANPLTDSRLEEVVLQKPGAFNLNIKAVNENSIDYTDNDQKRGTSADKSRQFFSLNLLRREPLHGCAFNGAVNITIQVQDAVTLAHGPRSCAHASYQTITSVGRKSLFERGVSMPVQILPPLVSSDMSEGVMVFGGIKELEGKIGMLRKQNPEAIFVVTTCPAGIIGDNLDTVEQVDENTRIIPVKTDGNLAGDYLQGMIMAYIEIARRLIKRDIMPEAKTINIIAEKSIASSTEKNLAFIQELLQALGLSINCRFICKTRVKDIENFLKARLNILAYDDYMGRMMRDFLQEEYGAEFMKSPFPVGFYDTRKWLYELASHFGKEACVEGIIKKYQAIYQARIKELKPILKNKRLMVITYNHDIDWILEPVLDAGMEIARVCILNYSQDNLFTTRFTGKFPVEENYDQKKRLEDIKREKPDILLSNYNSSAIDSEICCDTIPLCPDTGFFSGLEMARRWAEIYRINLTEGWKKDEVLFNKYFA